MTSEAANAGTTYISKEARRGRCKEKEIPPEGTHSEPKSLIARAAVGAAVVVVIIVAALQSQLLLWRPTGHYVV